MKPASFVYFVKPVGQDGPVKIGFSETPIDRLSTLMTWSPIPLEIAIAIPGDRELEGRRMTAPAPVPVLSHDGSVSVLGRSFPSWTEARQFLDQLCCELSECAPALIPSRRTDLPRRATAGDVSREVTVAGSLILARSRVPTLLPAFRAPQRNLHVLLNLHSSDASNATEHGEGAVPKCRKIRPELESVS